jgi:hypothetical protein
VTSRSALDAWEWHNEAYNAGRLIARADDEKFLMQRDPLNGAFIVQDGEPYTEYKIGQTVDYTNAKGAKVSLPIKTHGRLRLLLPDLGRLVQFTLKTTSFYDRLNITANLAAIQFLAETLNNGNAAGIPFFIYRREQDVVWNKKDGSAQRIKKWVVNIEADPAWVATAMQRLGQFALGDGAAKMALPAPMEINTPINPHEDGEDEAEPEAADASEDVIEGESKEVCPVCQKVYAVTAEGEKVCDCNDLATRPYKPDKVREKLAGLVERYAKYTPTDIERKAVSSVLATTFGGSVDDEQALCRFLFDGEPEGPQIIALKQWLKIKQGKDGDFYAEDGSSITEALTIAKMESER